MKNIQHSLIVLSALCLLFGSSFGGTIAVDLDREDVSLINGGEDGARHLKIDLSRLAIPEGVRVLSVYLYLDISADRRSDSEYPGEMLTIGVSPCTAQGQIIEDVQVSEFTLLPSALSSVALDLSRLFISNGNERENPSWVAVFSRDENEERYLLGLPRGTGFSGRLELRYSQ